MFFCLTLCSFVSSLFIGVHVLLYSTYALVYPHDTHPTTCLEFNLLMNTLWLHSESLDCAKQLLSQCEESVRCACHTYYTIENEYNTPS